MNPEGVTLLLLLILCKKFGSLAMIVSLAIKVSKQKLKCMAGTYSKIYIQIVFAVKGRQALISPRFKDEIYKYISGIITSKGHKAIIVNGVPDHIHLFIGLKPAVAISDLVRDIKNNSSRFINDRGLTPGRFSWQEGYGAFSYSPSHINNVYNYILNQEQHHKKKSFRDEYLKFLEEFGVEYKQEYLFKE